MDPWEHSYDSPTVARIALEVMALIMAAIRGDFLGEYVTLIERGAAHDHGSRSKKNKKPDKLNLAIRRELESGGLQSGAKEILNAILRDDSFQLRDTGRAIFFHPLVRR